MDKHLAVSCDHDTADDPEQAIAGRQVHLGGRYPKCPRDATCNNFRPVVALAELAMLEIALPGALLPKPLDVIWSAQPLLGLGPERFVLCSGPSRDIHGHGLRPASLAAIPDP